MDNPERRTQQRNILDENAVAGVEVDKLRAQAVGRSEAAFVHVDTILGHFQQTGACTVALAYHALFPSVFGCSAPWPPCLTCAASVDCSLTGDGYVGLFVGVDTGRDIPTVETFPSGQYHGVKFRFEGELQNSAFLHDQIDMA